MEPPSSIILDTDYSADPKSEDPLSVFMDTDTKERQQIFS